MEKEKRRKSSKSGLKTFLFENRMILATIGGLAAGFTVANVLGNERARGIVSTVGESVKTFSDKVLREFKNVHS
jgi:uncharacterized membrane protein YgaE (UPF0421/DUF939 family)